MPVLLYFQQDGPQVCSITLVCTSQPSFRKRSNQIWADISQSLAGRVSELAERYGNRASELEARVEELEKKVDGHLTAMGFSWS